jgi:ribonuclease D
VRYDQINSDRQLLEFCESISRAPAIAFDTEFVSEDSYRPDLCLVQVAAEGRLAVIDPKSVEDVTPFWKLLASDGHETIVHAGREEFRFCRQAVGKRPHNLFDVQLAAALIGLEYPAAYGTLIAKLLGKRLGKGETRTDWRKRPLSSNQLEYALQDVLYLEPLRHLIHERLDKLGRLSWLAGEIEAWQTDLEQFETAERWNRVAGISGMSARSLAIVRELWRWREQEAERRDRIPKRILRDDLLVEIAKRQVSDPKRLRAVRGMERGDLQRHLPDLGHCVERALELPDDQLPRFSRGDAGPPLNLLGQFLATALGSICRSAQVAPSLVGTAQDVRDLIAYRLGLNGADAEPPILATGWRAEVVGNLIDELLHGRLSIRITDPLSDHPLVFEPPGDGKNI